MQCISLLPVSNPYTLPHFPHPSHPGLRVFTVPEAATTLWSNGVSLADVLGSEETQYLFQDTILECV